MLKLGGIDNRPPKTDQSLGRFRVARNVYPTPDDRLIPRYDWGRESGQDIDVKNYHHITNYDNIPLSMASIFDGSDYYQRFYKNITRIPMAGYIGESPYTSGGDEPNDSVMSFRRNNTTYFMPPWDGGTISKYDGVQMWPAGCPQPITNSPDAKLLPIALASNDKYVKVIQHTTDFDNNDVSSEYVRFAVANATVSTNVRIDGATNVIGPLTISPQNVITNSEQPRLYFVGSGSYNAGTEDYSIAAPDTNITDTKFIGAYVFVGIIGATYPIGSGSVDALTFAMKIKSVSPLLLDAYDVKYLNLNREWVTESGLSSGLAGDITAGTQTFFSFWKSASKTGIYYFAGWAGSFPHSVGPYAYPVDLTSVTTALDGSTFLPVVLGPILNDIYDVNSRKLSPNAVYPFGLNYDLRCMTVYQDLLLFASDDLIWTSDPTLGGSFEQLNTSSFIRVGDTEFGRITSICGTQDFLVVCRERKNYYITGNITTGNYRVQEIIEAEIGAWNNVSTVNVKDSVIFLTAIGVYQVVSGGKATKLSETCPKNFESYDPMNVNEDVSFKMSGFVSDITNTIRDGLSVAYDEFRELLVFMKKGVVNSPCLVLHTKTGEFYEWDGLMWGYVTTFANSIAFIQAKYYVGQIEDAPATQGCLLTYEDKSLLAGYFPSNPTKLYTTWLTAGEPSLEKSLLQLKLFGRIETSGASVLSVAHYKDWDITTKITNTTYEPIIKLGSIDAQIQYSHKKRLTSDKVLAASVGIEITQNGTSFEIESFEVEFNPIQEGMKK